MPQYELLEKIHNLEERVREQEAHIESSDPQVRSLQQRNVDLEAQLAQSNKWREELIASSTQDRVLLEGEVARLKAELAAVKQESTALRGQMASMSSSVVKLAEKEQEVLAQVDRAKEATRARDGEIAVLRERVAQLADDSTWA